MPEVLKKGKMLKDWLFIQIYIQKVWPKYGRTSED
jgi:hypothetical protein